MTRVQKNNRFVLLSHGLVKALAQAYIHTPLLKKSMLACMSTRTVILPYVYLAVPPSYKDTVDHTYQSTILSCYIILSYQALSLLILSHICLSVSRTMAHPRLFYLITDVPSQNMSLGNHCIIKEKLRDKNVHILLDEASSPFPGLLASDVSSLHETSTAFTLSGFLHLLPEDNLIGRVLIVLLDELQAPDKCKRLGLRTYFPFLFRKSSEEHS